MTYLTAILESDIIKLLLIFAIFACGCIAYSKMKTRGFERINLPNDYDEADIIKILEGERDIGRFTHILLVGLVLCIVIPGIYLNGSIKNDALLHAGISALTLLFIWNDNKKRDAQHLEVIKTLTQTLRRDSIQKNIEAVANTIFDRREKNLESGIQFFVGKDRTDSNYDGCIALWNLEYRNTPSGSEKGNSYLFRVRFLTLESGIISELFGYEDFSKRESIYIPPTLINFLEDDKNLQLELLVNRTNETYGEFAERGYESIWHMSYETYYIVSNALASIQIFNDDELHACCATMQSYRSSKEGGDAQPCL